jgi:hypothetical protein
MRKRDVALTTEDLERPSDDPREYAALRHNVRQLQREIERVVDEVRTEYEGSVSWRATAPLRALRRFRPGA